MRSEGQSLRHRLSRLLRAGGDEGRLRRARGAVRVRASRGGLGAAGDRRERDDRHPRPGAGDERACRRDRLSRRLLAHVHRLDEPDAPGDAGDRLGDGADRLLRRDGRLHRRAERLRLHASTSTSVRARSSRSGRTATGRSRCRRLRPTGAASRTRTRCTPDTAFAGTGCELYYVPGTVVTATAAAAADEHVPRLERPSLRRDRARAPSRSAATPPRSSHASPRSRCASSGAAPAPRASSASRRGSPARRRASRRSRRDRGDADRAARSGRAFLAWKFGCTPATDPRRCVLAATNRPNWVGVALGEDAEIGQPTNLAVLFDVSRQGQGRRHRPRARLRRHLRAPVRLRLPGGVARDSGRPGGASRPGTARAPRRRCAGSMSGQ